MRIIDALVIPGCVHKLGSDGWWYFPCGLRVHGHFGGRPADEYRTPSGVPMLAVAHLQHHRDQHNERDVYCMVEYRSPPDGALMGVKCECLQDDEHWQYVNAFERPFVGGML